MSETARVEAFSDGVFAIAITLLILNIKIPAPSDGQLTRLLLGQWPSYLSFIISFAFIGIMWINHHRLFTHIRRSDHTLLVLNLVLLFGVCVVPFPTAVLSANLGHPDQRVAALLYNATYFLIAIAFNLLWRYAASSRRNLLAHDVDHAQVDRITAQYAYGPLLYLACLALAWVSVRASLALNLALAGYFALPPSVANRSPRH